MNNDSQHNHKDDEVLAQLYKAGSNETPSAKLNHKILDYAAKANKNADKPLSGSSHFGGGWKVPLSMAACLVVVFGLLVQIDQDNQTFDLPPIPEISTPAETSTSKQDASSDISADMDLPEDEAASFRSEKTEQQSQVAKEPQQFKELSKQQTEQIKPRTIEEGTQQIIKKEKAAAAPISSNSSGSYAPKPESIKKKSSVLMSDDVGLEAKQQSTEAMQQKPMSSEPMMDESQSNRSLGATASSSMSDEEAFATIPVEDWLLMIEKLIARKDYAEAARQLQKFKQAHPKVNVEDIDAKIP